MERRELIQWLVATAGLPNLAFGRRLYDHVERTLTVATERILPGAAGANVGVFIEKMLADWHTPAERERLLAGLADLDTRCRARASRAFVDCAPAEQVAVLTALDEEAFAPGTNEHWFARLKYLTVYGYCTSETGMRALRLYPQPWRYDGCAPA